MKKKSIFTIQQNSTDKVELPCHDCSNISSFKKKLLTSSLTPLEFSIQLSDPRNMSSVDWTWISACILGLIGIILFPWSYFRSRWLISRIPGPKGFPIFGILFDIWKLKSEEILPLIQSYWKNYAHNGIFKVIIVDRLIIHTCKPEYVQVILSDQGQIQKSLDYNTLRPWLGEGLLISSGAKWHSRRKLLTPSFHFRNLEMFIDVINEQSKILLQQLETEVGKDSFSIYPYISRCTLDVICETAMGRSIGSQLNHESQYIDAVETIGEIAHLRNLKLGLANDFIFNFTSMKKQQDECLEILHGFTNKVIKEKKLERKENREIYSNTPESSASGKKKRLAFLDLLLETSDNGRVLTDEDIREEVDTFMFAGHDTTATAISWTLYLLGHNPDIQERLVTELDNVIGTDDEITTKHLTQLKYLDQVVKESLRLYTPAPMLARYLTKEMKFGKFRIPAGVIVTIMPYFLHRNPEIFPDPEKFDPDRFLPEEIQKRHPYAYIPFSAGPRNCIGQKFALMEDKIILSHILRSYKITALEPRDKIQMTVDVILRAKNGIFLKIQPRHK